MRQTGSVARDERRSALAANEPQSQSGSSAAAPAEPQSGVETTAASTAAPVTKLGQLWALQGLSGVSIEIDESGESVLFQSLGADPLLDVTVLQQHRMDWLAWATALAIVVAGLLMVRTSLRARVRMVVAIVLLACGLPLLGGPLTEFSLVCETALLAALALVPLWVLWAFLASLRAGSGLCSIVPA